MDNIWLGVYGVMPRGIVNYMYLLQNEKKRKRKMQEKEGKSKKKDFKF